MPRPTTPQTCPCLPPPPSSAGSYCEGRAKRSLPLQRKPYSVAEKSLSHPTGRLLPIPFHGWDFLDQRAVGAEHDVLGPAGRGGGGDGQRHRAAGGAVSREQLDGLGARGRRTFKD